MGVDPERFGPHVSAGEWRALFQNVGQFVIGWVGSFRRFHAIELLLDAVQLLHQQGADIALVLVGDGPDRSHLERRVVDLGINNRVLFTGQVANTDVPTVLAAFDTAIITAERGQDFHYSPLKLREYLAMALPVVVPRIGEMARNLEDGTHGLLYEPGNRDELASTIGVLIDNPLRRTALGAAGYDLLCRTGTWDVLLASALTRLRELG